MMVGIDGYQLLEEKNIAASPSQDRYFQDSYYIGHSASKLNNESNLDKNNDEGDEN